MRRSIPMIAAALTGLLAGPAPARDLAVLPVRMLDTSGEVADQRAAHQARMTQMAADLTRDLAGRYDAIFEIAPGDLQRDCPGTDADCLLQLAERAGADLVLLPSVIKTSSLIMRIYVQIVDVQTGQIVQQRDLNFRGDTDESWIRAEQFLVRNLAQD
ncbi:DUF2380 domain-containing protein [Actibacterium ureilyticum]|uniref:DUF2380 domain-containing protein n=1 Tax=Actibacterium ureilyticum TaxID=1590614 RepID=UPI001C3EC597|nr:DUF2380 domain-containing protein [Actibacterium ureilyticum]